MKAAVANKNSTQETASKARRTTLVSENVLQGNSPSQPIDFAPIKLKTSCACGGGCPGCSKIHLQTKLKIGNSNDKYEQEADRVAEQIMRMPEPVIKRKPG